MFALFLYTEYQHCIYFNHIFKFMYSITIFFSNYATQMTKLQKHCHSLLVLVIKKNIDVTFYINRVITLEILKLIKWKLPVLMNFAYQIN